jgi:hypothetical protein
MRRTRAPCAYPSSTINDAPLIILVILWLAIIFASFGYRAPRNTIVTASLCLAALLISAALYLILDMDTPSSSMTQVSNVPFQRLLAQLALRCLRAALLRTAAQWWMCRSAHAAMWALHKSCVRFRKFPRFQADLAILRGL